MEEYRLAKQAGGVPNEAASQYQQNVFQRTIEKIKEDSESCHKKFERLQTDIKGFNASNCCKLLEKWAKFFQSYRDHNNIEYFGLMLCIRLAQTSVVDASVEELALAIWALGRTSAARGIVAKIPKLFQLMSTIFFDRLRHQYNVEEKPTEEHFFIRRILLVCEIDHVL